jgi:uncharacterized protein YndB with AHSA1/START domain
MEKQVIVSNKYNVPTHLLWEVLTKKHHMKNWYFDFADDWKLNIGNQFEWLSADNECVKWLHLGVIMEVIDNKKLVHSWEYPGFQGSSIVTWELLSVDDNSTQLELTHHFKVPFDPNVEALRIENFEKGWAHILRNSLMEYIEKIIH